jgi:FkbM family methyltransferase
MERQRLLHGLGNLIHEAFTVYTRAFPYQRGKRRLVRLLWHPLAFGDFEREVSLDLLDVRMKCDIRYFIQREIYFFRGFEHAECREWLRRTRDAKVIFDVGANVGVYSLLAARSNPSSRIHAFEPTQEIFERLRENVSLNGFSNIELNPVAVGEKVGTAYLYSCRGTDKQNEGMNYVGAASGDGALAVELTSLDEYCQRRQIDHIDVMKLDIEGGELGALAGARSLLEQRRIRCILLEMIEWSAQRSGHSRRDVAELLRGAGYALFELKGGALQRVPAPDLPVGFNVVALPA